MWYIEQQQQQQLAPPPPFHCNEPKHQLPPPKEECFLCCLPWCALRSVYFIVQEQTNFLHPPNVPNRRNTHSTAPPKGVVYERNGRFTMYSNGIQQHQLSLTLALFLSLSIFFCSNAHTVERRMHLLLAHVPLRSKTCTHAHAERHSAWSTVDCLDASHSGYIHAACSKVAAAAAAAGLITFASALTTCRATPACVQSCEQDERHSSKEKKGERARERYVQNTEKQTQSS